MKTGIEIIAEERRSQISKGWSLDHDKTEHSDGILADVAAYILTGMDSGTFPEWVYSLYDKIENDYVRRLQVSGALLAAEIDRETPSSPEQTEVSGEGQSARRKTVNTKP